MFVVNRIASDDLRVARARDVSLPWRTFLTSTGVAKMTQFTLATRAQIRNVVLCTLATLTLAACDGEDGSSSAAVASTASDSTASDSAASLASPSAGMIDPSQGIDTTTTASTTPTSGTTSGTATPVETTTTNGVATLDWMPPTENSDGSVLTNLAGYTVYYGTSPDSLTQSIKITNPGLAAYTVTNLQSGTWYFAVTSYSSAGVESTRTGTVSTTV
jgi:hypothetical protein